MTGSARGPRRLNLLKKGDPGDPGSDRVRIDVLVDAETGDFVMEGADTGPTVERIFGDDDYEYWVTVPKEHKDQLLLYLVQEVFGGGTGTSAPTGWLKEKGIPHEFYSY